jgi:hypothetical protein
VLKNRDLTTPPNRLAAGILAGCLAGILFVWAVVPREWTLSFWTTIAAAGNAAKYGHPVEHYAEGIVVAMMFYAVVGAATGGFLTHFTGVLLRQHKIRHEH